jgi:hypothetical protein
MRTLLRATQQALRATERTFSSSTANLDRKVAILGAAGGIGQPLGLLMKVCSIFQLFTLPLVQQFILANFLTCSATESLFPLVLFDLEQP